MEPLNKSEGCVKRGRFRLLLATLLLSMPMLAWAASAPSINNTHSTSTTDESTAQPFISPPVNISSTETNVSVILALDDAGKGSLANFGVFTDNGDGTYSFSGDPADANSALHAMVFTPAPNRVVPGTIETTTITITATDVNGSTPDSGTTIDTLSIDDAPALTGTTSNRNTTDKLATNLYAGFTVADVDQFGTQHVTVSIVQIRSTNGTLQLDSSGFTLSSLTPLTYTFEGTPTQATTGIRALSYRPTENIRPVGTNDITTFVVTVTDASGTDSSNSPFTNTVASLSINDPPVINGVSSTHQVLQTGRTNLPFAAAAITDLDVGDYTNEPNQHVSLQVSFAGMSGNGQWIPPAGLGFVSGSTYTLPVAKLSDATFALQHLAYQAQSFPISTTNTNTVTFTIVALDDHNGGATNTAAGVDIYTPYTPPGLSGTRSNQRVNDNASLALFSTVSIQSFNGGSFSVIINLSSDTNGSLINLSGFVRSGSNYVFTGSSEAATAAIRQLLFQPTNNRINGGTTDPTTFYITLVDGGVTSAPDSSTTVIVSPVNDAPVIQGISALVTITDTSTRNPFPTMSISDVDELGLQNLSVTVSIDNTNKGSFTTNSLAVSGFIANGVNYTRSGTPGQVTTAIRQLVFAPTHHLPSGATENTIFSVAVDDGQGGTAANSQTTIRVAALGGGPVFNLPSPQPLSLPLAAMLDPFSSSTVSDVQNLVLTVQVTNSIWGSFTSNSLAAGGFTNVSPGTYRVSGPDTNVTTYLQGLEFAPNTNLALGTVIVFNLNAVNQTGNATSTNLAITFRLNLRSLIVTKTSDYDPNDGSVTDAQKGGTLRKAIQDAGSNDHITFDIRSLSAGLPDYPATINLKKNLILNNNVVFDGPGADLLSISGDTDGDGIPDQQIFEVNAQVVINKLTFTKGHHPFSGGAIEVNPEGTLKLSYCAITDSSADVWGGGIDVNGGSLAMDHCLIRGNSTSASFGQGGGGLSLYSDQRCDLVNCTFAANQQLAPSGLGGGAVYAETIDSGVEFDVFVHSCTFHENFDAAGHGTSVRPNVFNTEIFLQNTIVADGHGKNLEMDQSGDVISLGGNISDDGTTSIFSMGGVPYDTTIFSQPPDFTNRVPNLLALADNHGPTFTYGLAFNSAAINTTVSNTSAALFYNTLATDQRSYWRTDGSPDIGAFERNASQRVIIEEILFADTNHQFIEFYVPRDSAPLNLDKFKVLLHGQLLHTFTNANLLPGEALVLFAHNAPNIAPTNVHSQIASSNLLMDVNADTITLLNPSNQVVHEVSYVGTFVSSDPNDAGFLTASNQSIVLSPPFQGCYLPYQRVVAHATGQTNVAGTSNPGFDPFDAPLGPGNAPPRAFDDFAATDAQTALPIIPVLNNDKDPDISDAIRVVGVGVTNVI